MTLPDFMDYKDKFTQRAFVEKISHVAKRAGAKMVYTALILYYTLESDKVSLKDKALIVGALGYLISPLDVIPDAIPIAGLGDDLAVLLFVLKKVWGEVSEDVKAKAQDKLKKWFDEDEIEELDRMNSEFRDISIEEESFINHFEKCAIDDENGLFMTTTQIQQQLVQKTGHKALSTQMLGHVLRDMKVERIKRGGVYGYLLKAKN